MAFQLVEFSTGHFGVRRSFLGITTGFVDLTHPRFSWNKTSRFFPDCLGTKDRATEVLAFASMKWRQVAPDRSE